jgi:hypothetical protein
MKFLLLFIGAVLILSGQFGFSDQIRDLENYIERAEITANSHDERMRLRDVKEYLGEVKLTSYFVTGSGLIISLVGGSLFFKKRK